MSSLAGCFIKTDLLNCGIIGCIASLINVMVDDTPKPGVVFTNEFANSFDGHGLRECHYHSLKQQGEPTAGSRPRNIYEFNSTILTFNAWYLGCQVGIMLEKV